MLRWLRVWCFQFILYTFFTSIRFLSFSSRFSDLYMFFQKMSLIFYTMSFSFHGSLFNLTNSGPLASHIFVDLLQVSIAHITYSCQNLFPGRGRYRVSLIVNYETCCCINWLKFWTNQWLSNHNLDSLCSSIDVKRFQE